MKIALGKVISTCRKYCGFKQDYMAHMIGCTTHTYANIENGRVDISVSKLAVLADVFGLKAHQIMNLAEEVFEVGDYSYLPETIKGMIRLTSINSQIYTLFTDDPDTPLSK